MAEKSPGIHHFGEKANPATTLFGEQKTCNPWHYWGIKK